MKTPLLALTLFALLVSACRTPEHSAYVTIGTVGSAADAAIGAYSEYITYHPVPEEQLRSVRRAVQVYVASVESAKLALTAYKSGIADRAALDRAIDALSAASAEVVRIIQLATTPPPVNPMTFNPQP